MPPLSQRFPPHANITEIMFTKFVNFSVSKVDTLSLKDLKTHKR